MKTYIKMSHNCISQYIVGDRHILWETARTEGDCMKSEVDCSTRISKVGDIVLCKLSVSTLSNFLFYCYCSAADRKKLAKFSCKLSRL
jgi:hypothetical protein